MDQWGPRRALSLKEARNRTALVHILRLLFTIGTVLSAGILIGFLVKHALEQGDVPPAPPTGITVLGPRFEGRDVHDRPYALTAETARRRTENPSLIDLTNPRLEDSTGATVAARDGVWNDKDDILDLVGDVVMKNSSGYTFTAERTRMFVQENRVEGPVPITGVGPMGQVKGDTYEVLEDGNRFILRGNVETIYTPKKRGARQPQVQP
jgi:lipopolysaccharide export system protein LptC